MARKFTAYVDESGDEGFNFRTVPGESGSSHWFILAAVIVDASIDQKTAQAINRIKSRLWTNRNPKWKKPLHWRTLRHELKKVAIQEIIREDFTLVAVAFEKSHPGVNFEKFDRKRIRADNPQIKSTLYFYVSHLLIEEIASFVKIQEGHVDVIFENRSSLSIEELQTYISYVFTQDQPTGKPVIPPHILTSIAAEDKQARKMLQIADICCGALFNALEPDRFGNMETSHILQLASKFVRPQKGTGNYGMRLYPGSFKERINRSSQYTWMKQFE